jgi:tRNA(fMet)-specific endonuclease VapC
VLDANDVVSEPLWPSPDPQVVDRWREQQTEIASGSVLWHELWYGCCRLPPSTRRTLIEAFLKDVVARAIPILSDDQRAAQWHAEERARPARIVRPPPFADGQIAAIAATNGLCLVTFNRDDYRCLPGPPDGRLAQSLMGKCCTILIPLL